MGTPTMISGKTINIVQVLPESILVCTGAQSWPHLTPPWPFTNRVILTEEEMVRTSFTCHLQSLYLSFPDQQYLKGKQFTTKKTVAKQSI